MNKVYKHIRNSLLLLLTCIFTTGAYSQWIAIDSLPNFVLDIGTSGGNLYVCTATAGVYVSHDSGATFIQSDSGLLNLNTRVILPKDSILILGTNNSIYKSVNGGASWVLSSNGFPTGGSQSNVEDLIYRGDSILVATYGHGIWCSTDQGQDWFSLNNGFPDLYRSCLLNNGSRIFTGTKYSGSGIFVSDDGGASWTAKNNGVPQLYMHPDKYVDIVSFTTIGSTIIAATLGGNVLASDDDGESWNILNDLNTYDWTITNINGTLLSGHDGAGVTESMDAGVTWEFKNEGLVTIGDHVVRTFCRLGDFIFAGTDAGVIFKRPVSEIGTATGEKSKQVPVRVCPDPVVSQARILVPFPLNENIRLEIFNETGIFVMRFAGTVSDMPVINRQDLYPGLYLLRITIQGLQVPAVKFVVK